MNDAAVTAGDTAFDSDASPQAAFSDLGNRDIAGVRRNLYRMVVWNAGRNGRGLTGWSRHSASV